MFSASVRPYSSTGAPGTDMPVDFTTLFPGTRAGTALVRNAYGYVLFAMTYSGGLGSNNRVIAYSGTSLAKLRKVYDVAVPAPYAYTTDGAHILKSGAAMYLDHSTAKAFIQRI
jgi:hypothetical protein